MTWEIAAGIITLVGFVSTVGVWFGKLSRTLATLDITIRTLSETINELKDSNKATHKDLYSKHVEHEHRLNDHEGRIIKLETKEKAHNAN
jgi:hypothetical protein